MCCRKPSARGRPGAVGGINDDVIVDQPSLANAAGDAMSHRAAQLGLAAPRRHRVDAEAFYAASSQFIAAYMRAA